MSAENNDARVLVVAKAPRAGEVKTRLVPRLGVEGAAALHAQLTERSVELAARAALGPVHLYAAPASDTFLRECATRHGAKLFDQPPGDLGERMRAAFTQTLDNAGAAILIGTDCPPLEVRHLKAAARALVSGQDAVFAPVEDGGYALIGLRRVSSRLFDGIKWSTDQVMDETRRRLRELDWQWSELETLWDIDRPADYERLVASGIDFKGNSRGSLTSYIG